MSTTFNFKFITKDATTFPESLYDQVDKNTLQKYPFLNTLIKSIVEDIQIDLTIETYEDLATYFIDDLQEEEDDLDNLPIFKEMNKLLKKDYDIIIANTEYSDITRDFLLSIGNIKELDD